MRITPHTKYDGLPCSYVGTGCAYEDITGKPFRCELPAGLKSDGYLPLNDMNRFLRSILPVKKKVYYRREERPLLQDFLLSNKKRCCVCVYGHFIYVNGHDYWSFFDNERDSVVCIWFF